MRLPGREASNLFCVSILSESLRKLDMSYILTVEPIHSAAAQQSGNNALGVTLLDLLQVQVSADDKGKTLHHAGVEQIVDGRLGKLCLEFGAEIVQNQQITGGSKLKGICLLAVPLEMLLFDRGKKILCGNIEDAVTFFNDFTGNGKRKMGLA